MIIETKTYWVVEGCPSDDDIAAALDVANSKDCRVDLCWFGPDNRYYGGHHSVFINPGENKDEIRARLPKMYGL